MERKDYYILKKKRETCTENRHSKFFWINGQYITFIIVACNFFLWHLCEILSRNKFTDNFFSKKINRWHLSPKEYSTFRRSSYLSTRCFWGFFVKILSPKNFDKNFYKGILHYNTNKMFTISADIVLKPQMLLMTPYEKENFFPK